MPWLAPLSARAASKFVETRCCELVPDADNPKIVFLGVTTTAKTAVFLVDKNLGVDTPGGIPRFRDEIRAREHGIGLDVPEHRRVGVGCPDTSRERTEARSNRKPLTCIVSTQYRRPSTIIRLTIGWCALSVFPVPVSLAYWLRPRSPPRHGLRMSLSHGRLVAVGFGAGDAAASRDSSSYASRSPMRSTVRSAGGFVASASGSGA